MRAVTDETSDIKIVANVADKLGRRIDDRYIYLFGREPLGNTVTYLAAAADDYFQVRPRVISAYGATRSVPYQ